MAHHHRLRWLLTVVRAGLVAWGQKRLREIRHRRAAESALRESEARFRLLIQRAPVPLGCLDKAGNVRSLNDRFTQLFGYTVADIPTFQDWARRAYPDEACRRTVLAAWQAARDQAARTGSVMSPVEATVTCRDGTLREVEIFGIDLGDDLLASFVDLTARRRVEAALQKTSSEMQQIFQNMINAFIVWESVFDAQGKYVSFRFGYFNDAYSRVSKLKLEEVRGKDVFEVWPTTEHSWLDVYGRVAVSGVPAVFDMYHDPTHGWYHCKAYRPTESPAQVCVIFEDITERKRADEEREKLQNQLNQAQKMESVGRLAGGVAHDFNNMLGAILGYAEMALEKIDASHPLYGDLMEIQQAAERSADLTRQLLTFARKQTVEPCRLDLNEAVAGLLKMLRRLIGEDVELQWQPAPELWPVRIDPTQVGQILTNLCVNARDAIAGVGRITIETGTAVWGEEDGVVPLDAAPGEYVMLAVSDTGCGLSPEAQAHLFEPFFTTKEAGRGTGLGLATVYGSVRQNHGFITVSSEPGRGTIVKIYLPRQVGTAESAAAPVAPLSIRGQETVLLVEDEAALLKMSRTMLEALGYRVLAAVTPEEAVTLAQNHDGEIHLLMTDLIMPGMNGHDLAQRLTALRPRLRSLFMSGYAADSVGQPEKPGAGWPFIQKPFSVKRLGAKLREVLEAKA